MTEREKEVKDCLRLHEKREREEVGRKGPDLLPMQERSLPLKFRSVEIVQQ